MRLASFNPTEINLPLGDLEVQGRWIVRQSKRHSPGTRSFLGPRLSPLPSALDEALIGGVNLLGSLQGGRDAKIRFISAHLGHLQPVSASRMWQIHANTGSRQFIGKALKALGAAADWPPGHSGFLATVSSRNTLDASYRAYQ